MEPAQFPRIRTSGGCLTSHQGFVGHVGLALHLQQPPLQLVTLPFRLLAEVLLPGQPLALHLTGET